MRFRSLTSRRGRVALLGVVMASSTMAAPALANGPAAGQSSVPSAAEVQEIFSRVNATGSLSDTDRARLLQLPEASTILDPESGEVVAETTKPTAITAAATSGCMTKDRYVVYKSLTRSKTVDYHFQVNWCYKNSVITSTSRSHYIKSYTIGMKDRGFINNVVSWTRTNHYSAQVDLQAEVEQCLLKYGCIWSVHPRSRWGIYGNGDYTYQAWK